MRRYARRWSKERGESTAAAYVPLSFAPGEAYQFDWSHEVVLLNGVTVIVKAAHVRLCHSRMLFVRCYRLYLPEDWAADRARRCKAGVPEDLGFATKPEIALAQIEAACTAGLPRGVVLMDAGYGCNTALRTGISALELRYVAGILPNTSLVYSLIEQA